MTFELAVMGGTGEWELIGDFADLDEIESAALAVAPHCHHDAAGCVRFGMSRSARGGHYEYTLFARKTDAGHELSEA